jgi:hypothetical protein
MAPKPLFTDGVFSQIGRKTQEHLNALRTQLGVDCDPAYDYSEIIARQQELAKKKVKTSDEETPVEPAGPLAELQSALTAAAEAQNEKAEEDADRPPTPPHLRLKQKVREEWMFTCSSRDQLYERLYNRQFHPPPPGHYRPKDVFPDHRPVTKGISPAATVFPEHKYESILKKKEREQSGPKSANPDPFFGRLPATSIEMSDYMFSSYGPEKASRPKVNLYPGLDKQLPRPDMGKMSNISMRDPIPGIENVDETAILSTAPNQPKWDFSKWIERESPGIQPFHCGQYAPNYNMTNPRNDIVGIAFEKQMDRPDPQEGFGRNKPAKPESYGKSIPVDRSLHRGVPGIVSTIPRIPGVDLSKALARPPMAKTVVHYKESDPKIMKEVMKREMETQWQDTFKVVAPRNDFAPNFKKALRRERAIMGSRLMLTDPSLLKARNPQEPTSIESMDIDQIDSQLAKPRIKQVDFKTMAARGQTKKYVDLAARFQEPSTFTFERALHGSESHPMLDTLSRTSMDVGELRQTRSFKELPDWEDYCNSSV